MAMNGLLDDLLVEISVNASSAFVLRRVVNASPVNFSVSRFLPNEDVSIVLQLIFSFLTQHVLDFWLI